MEAAAYRVTIVLCLLMLVAATARAYPVRDSVFYRDSVTTQLTLERHAPSSVIIGGGANFLSYRDSRPPLPLGTDCDTFISGHGVRPYFDLALDIPITHTLHLQPGLEFASLGADHTFAQFVTTADTAGGKRTTATSEFDHIITNTTLAFGLSALVEWTPLERFKLAAGPSLRFLFDQRATKTVHDVSAGYLIDPTSGARVSSYTEVPLSSMPNAKTILPALLLRAGYEVPLSQNCFAMPNVAAVISLGKVTDYFSPTEYRVGLALRYELPAHTDSVWTQTHHNVEAHIAVAEPPAKHIFKTDIEAFATSVSGAHERVARLEVQEIKARNAYPILNYIFFDSAASAIPSRYVLYSSPEEASQKFRGSLERRGERTTSLYLETLNILGDRLRHDPAATITLVGSTSNNGAEEGNPSLARKRAEAVKAYLQNVWNIEPKRITVNATLLPAKPSPNDIAEGQAENRRVEIISNSEKITDPIYITNIEHTATPPHIDITPVFDSHDTIGPYHISIRIAGKEIAGFDGDSSNISQSKDWTITEDALSSNADSLEIVMNASNAAGEHSLARTAIGLEQQHLEHEIEQKVDRFSLILFGFDESSLGAKNERTLGLVADALKRIRPRKVIIRGYTDELGDADHNKLLSLERAKAAAESLQKALHERSSELPKNTIVEGKGGREHLYDDRTPEGRFFSRTVMITIER